MEKHPLGVACPTCTKDDMLFPVVHYLGPSCLACGAKSMCDDGYEKWHCRECGAEEVFDVDDILL